MAIGKNDPGQNTPKFETQSFSITVSAVAAAVNGFNTAALMARVAATGLLFPSGTAVNTADSIHQRDIGLKPVGGHFFDGTTQVESTTSDAQIELPAGGGEWRDLDARGSHDEKVDAGYVLNDFNLNVDQGSIVVISGSVWRKVH